MMSRGGSLIARVRNIALADPQRMEQSTAEHRTVVNAIQRQDPEGAQRAMHDHLLSAEQIVSGILQNVAAPLRGYRF
jgi:DNA-binding FadR family transcriptional regulator